MVSCEPGESLGVISAVSLALLAGWWPLNVVDVFAGMVGKAVKLSPEPSALSVLGSAGLFDRAPNLACSKFQRLQRLLNPLWAGRRMIGFLGFESVELGPQVSLFKNALQEVNKRHS